MDDRMKNSIEQGREEHDVSCTNRTANKLCQRQLSGYCGRCLKCVGIGSDQYTSVDKHVGSDERDKIVVAINMLQVFRRRIERGEENLELNVEEVIYNGVTEEIDSIIKKIQPMVDDYNESKVPAVALMSSVNVAIYNLVNLRKALDYKNRTMYYNELMNALL